VSEKKVKYGKRMPIHTLRVTYYSNGQVTFHGIPEDRETAVAMCADLFKAVLEFFVAKAEKGEDTAEPKKIITFSGHA